MAKRKILTDITISEISAVDEPAQRGARAVLMKRGQDPAMGKRASLLTSVGGHSHVLSEQDYEGRQLDAGETSYAEGEGDEHGHTHPWIRREDGTILIGEAAGHTHEIQATTKRAEGDDAMTTKTAEQLQKDLEAKEAEIKKAKEAADAELAKAKAERDEALAIAKMSDKERKAFDAMDDDEEKKKFLAADAAERQKVLSKMDEADPVIYKAKDGTEYRKSDGKLADFAKRDDAREEEMAKARAEAQDARIEKRIAAEFPSFPDAKAAAVLLKAVDGVEDEEVRKACDKLLKSAHAALDRFTKMDGHRGGETDPAVHKAQGDFDQKVAEIRKRDDCTHQEAMRKAREEHPELFKAYRGLPEGQSAAA